MGGDLEPLYTETCLRRGLGSWVLFLFLRYLGSSFTC